MTNFKEALLGRLLDEQRVALDTSDAVPGTMSGGRRRIGYRLAGVAAGVAAVAALALFSVYGTAGPSGAPDRPHTGAAAPPTYRADSSGYTLTANHDGSVSVTLHGVIDTGQLTRDLRRAGINAVVLTWSPPGQCPVTTADLQIVPGTSGGEVIGNDDVALAAKIFGQQPGLLLIVLGRTPDNFPTMDTENIEGPAPSCVSRPVLPPSTDSASPPVEPTDTATYVPTP